MLGMWGCDGDRETPPVHHPMAQHHHPCPHAPGWAAKHHKTPACAAPGDTQSLSSP